MTLKLNNTITLAKAFTANLSFDKLFVEYLTEKQLNAGFEYILTESTIKDFYAIWQEAHAVGYYADRLEF